MGVLAPYGAEPPTPQFKVDGTTYSARSVSYTFYWTVGSEHTISYVTGTFCDDPPSNLDCGPNRKAEVSVSCWWTEGLEVTGYCSDIVDGAFCTCIKIRVDSDGGVVHGGWGPLCCLPKNNILGTCDPNNPYEDDSSKCVWRSCTTNGDCTDGNCCDRDPSIAGGDQGDGSCSYGKGTVYRSKYLCDPPAWSAKNENKVVSKTTYNIFELILNFFSQFFTQR